MYIVIKKPFINCKFYMESLFCIMNSKIQARKTIGLGKGENKAW